jgi:NAD(P)-dependent dehydrogenase (short-subunit alcohol dehydrogenase family)
VGRLDGKVAIVTGAGSGIGEATARLMAHEGASVVVADINRPAAERVAAELAQGVAVEVDVSDESSIVRMINAAVDSFGGLDILHNNAAALGADVFPYDNGITEMDVNVWDRTMAVNLRGVMLGCKHAIPVMRDGGGGSIVSTSSLSSLIGEDTHLAYACSKAAIGALTRHVATMHGDDGIRINAVAPGLMLTPIALERLTERDLAAFRSERLLERATRPEDVANLVVFLASDQAACITGQVYVIDGGTMAKRPRRAMADWQVYLAGHPDRPLP